MSLTKSLTDHPDRWAIFLIVASTLVRFSFVATGQLTLVQDEAQYWDWTRHPQLSYYSKGPLISWIIALWTAVFGDTELGVRFGSVFNSMLTQTVLYFSVSRLFERPILALATLLVFNTMLLFCGLSILMTTDSPLILCYAVFLFSLYAGLRPRPGEESPALPFVLMAFSLAVGILAKYMMLIAVPQALVYAYVQRRNLQRRAVSRLMLSLSAGAFAGTAPILIWNARNDFVGFRHVAHLAGAAGTEDKPFFRLDRFPDYIGSQFALATPWWLLLMLTETWKRLRSATADDILPDKAHARLLVLFTMPLWLFVLFWSFHTKIMPNWVAVTYIPGSVLAAAGLMRLFRSVSFRARSTGIAVISLATFMFVLAHFWHLLPIPTGIDPTRRVKGWEELGETVERYRETAFADPSRVFIFSDQYDMTSALAFYVPGQPRTYCVWADRRMNQYDLWPAPGQDETGWDAVLVYKHQKEPTPDQVVIDMFESWEGPIPVTTTYRGETARKFSIFLMRGYKGSWPGPQQESY